MRVTFVLPSFNLSGGSLIVAGYASFLASKGHAVTVVGEKAKLTTVREFLRGLRRGKLPSRPPRIVDRFTGVDIREVDSLDISTGKALPDADVLIGTWWETVEWVLSAPSEKGLKIHFVQDHEVFEYLPQDRTRAVLKTRLPKITVSNWLYELLRTEYGADGTVLVPYGIEVKRFEGPPRNKQDVPTFGFLFNKAPRKNVKLTIDALTAAKTDVPSLRAIAFGAVDAELPSFVEYHRSPPKNMIPELYASCDAWLFTSISEGFGLPILEAMASRTPVIATRAGGAPEYVSVETGIPVEQDIASVVSAIRKIAQMSNDEWRNLSTNAFECVRGETFEKAASAFERALGDLCANTKS